MMGTRTALVLLLTIISAVCATSEVTSDGKVILKKDSCTKEQDLIQTKVQEDYWPEIQTSYAGYVLVDDQNDINLFFWFCMAKPEKRDTAPVVLWLNGGPGVSSMVGAMLENGPFVIHENGSVMERKQSWTSEFNMLYVDNPVGVGYSFSSQATLRDNLTVIASDLYQLLLHLNKCLFPEYFSNGLYIGGQSYAGKYIPHLGQFIHDQNQVVPSEDHISLKGIYLGNAFCDPRSMYLAYPDYLYQLGIYSNKTRKEHQTRIETFLDETKNDVTFNETSINYALFSIPTSQQGYLSSLQSPEVSIYGPEGTLQTWLNSSVIRGLFHAGDVSGGSYKTYSPEIQSLLNVNDFMHGTILQNQCLMDNYKVLQYTGNFDLLVTVVMTDKFLDQVPWMGRDQFRQAEYTKWGPDVSPYGWYATVGSFTRVIIRNAGHYVPFDKPDASLAMMRNFINGESFE